MSTGRGVGLHLWMQGVACTSREGKGCWQPSLGTCITDALSLRCVLIVKSGTQGEIGSVDTGQKIFLQRSLFRLLDLIFFN